MANLIIDIGNTAVKASWSEGLTLGKTYRYQGENIQNFINNLTEKHKPEVLVVSSVYEISDSDTKYFQSISNKFIVLDSAHPEVLLERNLPSFLSYDRAASIIAVKHLFRNNSCTIVDFGTTLTIDLIDGNGNYEGGNISLGLRSRLRAINRYSRSLPLIDTPSENMVIGSDLNSSISSGVVSGIMFEIEGYKRLYPNNLVVFTGGDSIFFAKRMKNSIFVVCNLVLIGLAKIANEYVKNI